MAWLVSQRSFRALLHEKKIPWKLLLQKGYHTNFQSPPYVLSIRSNHPLSFELVPKSRLAHGLCRDHWCNYIPVWITIEDWHTRVYCYGPSKCLLLNMNSVIYYLNPIKNNKQWCFVLSMIKVYVVVQFYPWFNTVYGNIWKWG